MILFLNFLYHFLAWHFIRGADIGRKKAWYDGKLQSLAFKAQDLKGKISFVLINKTSYAIGAGLLLFPFGWKIALATTLGLLVAMAPGRQFDGMDGNHKSRLHGTLQGMARNLTFIPLFLALLPDWYGLGMGMICGTLMACMHPFSNILTKTPTVALVEVLEGFVLGMSMVGILAWQ